MADPLIGSTEESMITDAFDPAFDKATTIILSGDWTGTVQVMRSFNKGETMHPMTIDGRPYAQFTGNACEDILYDTDGKSRLYLDIEITGGLLNYELR